jgi:hypothetical protein
MSYYDYEDYYGEPSKFEQQIEEFKDSLFNAVKQEHKDKMDQLIKENQELQEVKKNWKAVESEYKSKIRELENEKSKLELNAKRMRLDELFEGEFNTILYSPDDIFVYASKCDKCDDNRKVKFLSPSGKEMEEDCECGKAYRKYITHSYYCTEFRVNRRKEKGEMPLLMWYKKYSDYSSDYDGYTYDSSNLVKKIYSPDLDFETIYNDYKYSIYFKNEEDCQKYCDWLNDKNGITNDMTTEKFPNKVQRKSK